MKKFFYAIVLTLSVFFTATGVFAQHEPGAAGFYRTPQWVSDKGYWVIESHKNNPSSNILYFYNNEKVLVYKEKTEGVVINIHKRSIKMRLKKVLDQSVLAYEQRKHGAENERWVMNLLKR
jgi:hypothetical protein